MSENQIEIYINGRLFPRGSQLSSRLMVELLEKHYKSKKLWKGRFVVGHDSGVEGELGDFTEWHRFDLVRGAR